MPKAESKVTENTKPVELKILVTARIMGVLEELASTGLFASDAEEVACELLSAAVRREIVNGGGSALR